MNDLTLSRRHFITTALTAAGGLALGVGLADSTEAASLSVRPWGEEAKRFPGEINAWVVIEPDDTVIIRYGRAEMGQGSFTALPQILAEELECDWAFVKPEYASANRNVVDNKVYGSLSTGGSRAVRETGVIVQQAGASARKRPDQYQFIGRRLARLDIPLKINGSAKFGIDLEVPDMVRAAIIKCPVFGGTVKSVDESKIAGRRGNLQVVKLKNAVAVVADRYYRAQDALNSLKIEWDVGAAGTTNSAQFRKEYLEALDQKGVEARHDGNVDAAMPTAAKVIEATYEVPIIAHA